MDSLIALASRRFVAGVSPALGGSLVYFGTPGESSVDFVRPTGVRALIDHNARASSGYPMVPYSNRIADGRFRFDGVDYVLPRNSSIPMHPIHGIGWLRAWDVIESSSSRVTLSLRHAATGPSDPAWPWSLEAAQSFDLDDERLRWTLAVTNRDRHAMPAGLGMHPFFPKPPATSLQFSARAVWQNDDRMLPVAHTDVPRAWDFRSLRPLGDLAVDNCFAGWTGEAQIAWPDRGWSLAIAADSVFGHLVVFTSPARDSIALEPISHANNALNLAAQRADTGLHVLQPGETLSGAFTMRPIALKPNE